MGCERRRASILPPVRVLVTGGHGFVGSHLVRRLLAQGDTVRCLIRRPGVPPSLDGLDVELCVGDLRTPDALRRAVEGVDEIFHLAALTRSRTRRAMFATNVAATESLLLAARAEGLPGTFVFCSSLAAVGPSPDDRAVDERTPRRPVTWYGESKACAEDAVLAASGELAVTVLRPPAVYGPRDRDFLAVFQAAQRGILPRLGDGPRAYSFVFAPDLAEAMVEAARCPAARARTLFVAHPARVELEAFLAAVALAVGRRARVVRVPDATLRILAELSEVGAQLAKRPPLLNRQRLREMAGRVYVCRGEAFEETVGWQATTGIVAGCAATAAWYRERGWLPSQSTR